MTGLIVVNVMLLAIIAAMLVAWLIAQQRGGETSAALRALLLDRAAGKITEEEFGQRQAALHAAMLEPRPAIHPIYRWIAAPVILAFGVAGYLWMADKKTDPALPGPMALNPPSYPLLGKTKQADAKPGEPAQANSGGDLHVMAKRLAEKMAKDPKNGEGWLLLARTYGELRQPKEAAEAYSKAAALLAPDATLFADWADAQVMANGRQWNVDAGKAVQRALAADPKHVKALALAGSEAFDRADYKAAIAYWKRMAAAAPADSMDAKLAAENIQEAEARLSGKKPLDRIMDSAAPPAKQ